jgi:hypothetical protein
MKREYLWALVTLIVAITLAYVLLTLTKDAPSQTQQAQHVMPPCLSKEDQDRVRGIVLKALDDALETHAEHLFAVFLQDPAGGHARASRGMQNGIAAWLKSRQLVLVWSPLEC